MAIGTPSNLSLSNLGVITGSNSGAGTQTSLRYCRGYTAAQTSMWADFRIGTSGHLPSITWSEGSGTTGSAKGYFQVKIKNDVGEYMGAGSSGEWIKGSLGTSLNENRTYYWNVIESVGGVGSLYQSRIANRSANSTDYEGGFDLVLGTFGVVAQQYGTGEDSFRHDGGV